MIPPAPLVVMLRGPKMFGMAQAVGELAEQGAREFEATVPILSQLLKAEMAEREVRSIAYTRPRFGSAPGIAKRTLTSSVSGAAVTGLTG